MRKFFTKKRIVVLTISAVTIGITAGGYAYFSSTGTGSGSGKVGTSTTWAVTTDAYTGGPLTPGGTTESVAYHVKNNSTGYQNLNEVDISVANSNGTAWTAVTGCSASDFNLDAAGAGTTDADLPNVDLAPGATYDGTVTLAMVDSGSNQDGCKNATVPLYLSAS
ncbi:MAG: hypothetical protein E6J20_18795 [Chloroflexi bacterium]|nr:MAG: hypothetical protein E6J20_18795 [Chloroflexota bacterium]